MTKSIAAEELLAFINHKIKIGDFDDTTIFYPGLINMADVINHRSMPGPGSGAGVESPPQSLSDVLRSAIAESRLRYVVLARATSINDQQIRDFVGRKRDMRLESADRIASQVGVKLVMEGRASGPSAGDEPPTRNLTDVLLSAIEASGRTPYALAKESGLSIPTVYSFISGRSLLLASADKLLGVLAIKVIREGPPDPPPEATHAARPFTDALLEAIDKSGMNANALARASGLCAHPVYDFVSGKRSLLLQSADAIAVFLGLHVVRPDSDARAEGTARPFTDALLEAIDKSGMNANALTKASGVERMAARRFLVYSRSLLLASADKFAVALGLEVVRPDTDARPATPPQPHSSKLLSAIAESGKNVNELARRSGIPSGTICRFLTGKGNLRDSHALKLAKALGVEPEPARLQVHSTEVSTLAEVAPLGPSVDRSMASADVATISRAELGSGRSATAPGSRQTETTQQEASLIVSESPNVAPDRAGRPEPVPWGGTPEELLRDIDAIESGACRDVVRKLIELMPLRPTKAKLETESGHGDAVNHLKRLADSGNRLGRALGFPGRGRHGYWIEIFQDHPA